VSSIRLQKLNALLKRVEERRHAPRLQAVPAPVQSAKAAEAKAPTEDSEPDLFAATIPPAAGSPPSMAPAPVSNAEQARRAPSASPLEDAMAQLGAEREDSGPLQVQSLSTPITVSRPSLATPERFSEASPRINQDLVLTHRPEASPEAQGPIVELVQAKSPTVREPTIQFDTGVKANPLTQRDLKPAGAAEAPVEGPLAGPTHKLEPLPLPAHAAPARAVSVARSEAVKTFGELLDLSLSLRPTSSGSSR
jgi:hypothetical protein